MDWTVSSANETAQDFVQAFGLPDQKPKMLRIGSNAVFEVHSAKKQRLVLRIVKGRGDIENCFKEVDFTDWLASQGFPCCIPVRPPLQYEDTCASLWYFVEHHPGDISTHDFGKLLQRFHGLARKYPNPLPVFDLSQRIMTRINRLQTNEVVDEQTKAFLKEIGLRLEHSSRRIGLPCDGVIHGDFHNGNILLGPSGPVLLDFEAVERGPLQWELASIYTSSKWLSEIDFDEFTASYGYDIRTFPHLETLVEIRLFSNIVWLGNLPATQEIKEEHARRMLYWTDRPNAPKWNAT